MYRFFVRVQDCPRTSKSQSSQTRKARSFKPFLAKPKREKELRVTENRVYRSDVFPAALLRSICYSPYVKSTAILSYSLRHTARIHYAHQVRKPRA